MIVEEKDGDISLYYQMNNLRGDLTYKNNANEESKYALQYWRSKTPSEHQFDATERRLELQFTHFGYDNFSRVTQDKQLILALTFHQSEEENEGFLASFIDEDGDVKVGENIQFKNFADFMNRFKYYNFYVYEGSQTIPSC